MKPILRSRRCYIGCFSDGNGEALTLSGHKIIKDDPGFDLWHDTTTLYTRILRGHVTAEEEKALEQNGQLEPAVAGSGIIVIPFFSFLKQLTTFAPRGRHCRTRPRRWPVLAGCLWASCGMYTRGRC